jgi:fatty acid desaturase
VRPKSCQSLPTLMPEPSTPPLLPSIAITLLLVIAALATMGLFAIPLHSQWFWPTAGVLAASAGLAMAIPLKSKK